MSQEQSINITLKVWRQNGPKEKGKLETYEAKNISTDASFLEMLDIVNEDLIKQNKDPIAFDHDCREGICGCCGSVVNGCAHGPEKETTLCQLHMRKFKNGDVIYVEPFKARAFPIIKDLVVDRSALDRIIMAGGYVSVNTGSAQDANAILIGKKAADEAFDAATCIGCGACIAACKNASAMLFAAAKVSHLVLLPQGQIEKKERARALVAKMDAEGFGSCSNTGACALACPKGIDLAHIARLNRQLLGALISE